MQGVEGEELGRDGLGVYLCIYGIRRLGQDMYYVVRILCSQQGNPVITNVYACYMYGARKKACEVLLSLLLATLSPAHLG